MRVIVRAATESGFSTLQHRFKQKQISIKHENKKEHFFTFDLPKTSSEFLYEILELGGRVERDIKHDLD